MDEFEPNMIGFFCNWCSYAAADLAGTSRMEYPANIKTIRVMCSSRVDPLYLLKALLQGADGVLMAGCHPGECHYSVGNLHARRRFAILKTILETLGLESDRLRLSWISASEGGKVQKVVTDFVEQIKQQGKNKVRNEIFL